VRTAALLAGLVGLAVCLVSPVAYLRGSLDEEAMKALFLLGSAVWFVAASIWTALRS
jgi:hypothetical protein